MQIDPDTARNRAVPAPSDQMQLRDLLALLADGGAPMPSGAEWLLDRLDRDAEGRP